MLYVLTQGHLVPSDEITVYYRCQPDGEYLGSVIQAHTDFILATTKAPLLPYPVPKGAGVIIQEMTQVRVCISPVEPPNVNIQIYWFFYLFIYFN